MKNTRQLHGVYQELGLTLERTSGKVYHDAPVNTLVEQILRHDQGHLSRYGGVVVETGTHTGRSAGDKYVVKSESTKEKIWWENQLNEMSADSFERLQQRIVRHLNESGDLYITERMVGADPTYNCGVRLVTTHPAHALFSTHVFRDADRAMVPDDFIILHAPTLSLNPEEFGIKSDTCIATDFDRRITLIAGTMYAGEIKKSMFSVLNYVLPDDGILPMHAGCNRLQNGETSVFFGLSGTGKTTLSTDQGTLLIGDDEHGMSDDGVFNFEGGCYAKTYKLSKEGEPGIFAAANRFGSLLENVVLMPETGEVDFFNKTLTENGRCSYPLDFIDDLEPSSRGKIPSHVFFLTADAFGILPPVARLNPAQAMFYFVLGYTAKLAGTEIGIKEPQPSFSPCFGAPFMLRHPSVYAELLGQFLDKHGIHVWLINTGWTGGPYGVGKRFPLDVTRTIIRTIQSNALNNVPTEADPLFGFEVPLAVQNVPSSYLHPQSSWPDPDAYQKQAKALAISFHKQMRAFGAFYEKNRSGAPTFEG